MKFPPIFLIINYISDFCLDAVGVDNAAAHASVEIDGFLPFEIHTDIAAHHAGIVL